LKPVTKFASIKPSGSKSFDIVYFYKNVSLKKVTKKQTLLEAYRQLLKILFLLQMFNISPTGQTKINLKPFREAIIG
jgi:hypothetical protein